MRILFTGSRHLRNPQIIRDALDDLAIAFADPSELTFVHGAAVGADALVDAIGREMGVTVEVHPAEWNRYGRRAGPLRNSLMVSRGADICLAFPDSTSRGTADCLEKAWRTGIPTRVYPVRGS